MSGLVRLMEHSYHSRHVMLEIKGLFLSKDDCAAAEMTLGF